MMKSLPYKLLLASNSPRRKELLSGLGWPFEVCVKSGVDETYPHDLPAKEVALFLAKKKAAAYTVQPHELLLTADTVVIVDNQVLGKPQSREEAMDMLRFISGKTHVVETGVCLKTSEKSKAFSVETHVSFKVLTEKEIAYYVDTYRPYDKAGAYGIQEWIGYIGVTALQGSYFNVMGLPVQRIYEEVKAF